MRFEKKIETVNLFRIQVKMSTFVQFQLKIDENNLNVNKKLTFLGGGGAKVLLKKIEFRQKKDFDGRKAISFNRSIFSLFQVQKYIFFISGTEVYFPTDIIAGLLCLGVELGKD